MAVLSFPPVELADHDGLLAAGGDLEVSTLLLAYRSGIFPWPVEEGQLLWFAPPERAVLFLDEFHLSQRASRALKKAPFHTRMNTAFRDVITRCAELQNRGDQRGTWITPEIVEAYTELHRAGHCHSFETYCGDELVGGLYGVQIGRMFAAESSFYRRPDASKAAMCRLVEHLHSQSIPWFDCQVLTPFSESFGAREVPRSVFMTMLQSALAG
jgi:leucyl/phenylalanyl-tRNA--protein transferase